MRWFACWNVAWMHLVMGEYDPEFERAKFAVNHGMR